MTENDNLTHHGAISLTDRELELVRLLTDGLTNQRIADQTGLTLYTVKWYLKQIYSKLYVANRTQAVKKAGEIGLLNSDASTKSKHHILPERLTSFLGRQQELTELEGLLQREDARLLTIYGMGGIGKTSLALEVARRVQAVFVDGVFFVNLSHRTQNPLAFIVQKEDSGIEEAAAFFYNKRALLVLDNFELLLNYAAELSALLQRTRHLKIMVTSRERLNLQGEVIYPLGGLSVDGTSSNETGDAHALFIQRAQVMLPTFQPSQPEKQIINKICRLLGGVPLAIEMAAAWVPVLSLDKMYHQVTQSLDLLATDDKDRPQRQQSMRTIFDFSLQQLPDDTLRALLRLGIFQTNRFTLDAAEAIAEITPKQLKQLLDCALIQRDEASFVFQPLIQQYVTEKLKQDKALMIVAQQAHSNYYLSFITTCLKQIQYVLSVDVIPRFLLERDNIVYAWFYALQKGHFQALEPLVDVGAIYDLAGLWQAGETLFMDSLRYVPSEQRILRGRLLAYCAVFAWRSNDAQKIRAYADQVENLLKNTPYTRDIAVVLCQYAMAAVNTDYPESLDVLDHVDQLLQDIDPNHNAFSRLKVECARPAVVFSAGHYAQALPLLEKMPAPDWHPMRLFLSETYVSLNMPNKARALLAQQRQIARTLGYRRLAIGVAFYTTLLDTPPENLPEMIAHAFLAEIQTALDYPALNIYHWTLGILQRGQRAWAMLILNANIVVLNELNEVFLMYRYILRTAEALKTYQIAGSDILFAALVADPNCPAEIQLQAAEQIQREPLTSSDNTPLLKTVSEVLLSKT